MSKDDILAQGRPVTIKDVARLAGVSPKTVSNVVNNRPVVKPTTRQRVLDAIRALDYHPSALARGMVTRSRRLIGLVLADITNPAYPEMVEGVASLARQAGFMVMLCNTGRDPDEEQRYVHLLIEQRVDGVIIASSRMDSQAAEMLTSAGIKVVLFNRHPEQYSVSFVGVDNEGGGYLATRHLLDLGHRRIAFIRGTRGASTSIEREQGYRRALGEYGIEPDPELIGWGDYHPEVARTAADLLLRMKNRPTAVFAANDVMALSVIDAATSLGLRVPEDLAVVGFDDIAIASHRLIGLSTIHGDLGQLSREATTLLLEAVNGNLTEPVRKILPVYLVVRRTCGAQRPTAIRE